uniref:Uncharacterized protein n=1 Tax=Morchella brunnea TaxID=1174671 RepID=A0A8K1MIH1_9PEZI|nr:hypothetical protein LK370_mgp022 [Morchella brunnea]UBU98462.1 hypothetical protein [Morchella brunnea]
MLCWPRRLFSRPTGRPAPWYAPPHCDGLPLFFTLHADQGVWFSNQMPWSACPTLLILELHILWISLLHWDIQGDIHRLNLVGGRYIFFTVLDIYVIPPAHPGINRAGSYFLWKKPWFC